MTTRIHGPALSTANIPAGAVATADLAAGAVTGPKLGSAALKAFTFVGRNGAGACTATGLAVGDRVVSVAGLASATAGNQAAKFETTITVVDEIQQSDAGNLSANVYVAMVLPAAA